jgi:hypothetical protein
MFGGYTPPRGVVQDEVRAVCIQGRAKGQCVEARREVVRDLMRYMNRRLCSHWTVCVWSCARIRDVLWRALEMSLSGGSVRAVSREVRLVMMEECGVPVRLMTMGRMSTIVPGQWLRMAFAGEVYLARMR